MEELLVRCLACAIFDSSSLSLMVNLLEAQQELHKTQKSSAYLLKSTFLVHRGKYALAGGGEAVVFHTITLTTKCGCVFENFHL